MKCLLCLKNLKVQNQVDSFHNISAFINLCIENSTIIKIHPINNSELKTPASSLFFRQVAGLRPATLFKKRGSDIGIFL